MIRAIVILLLSSVAYAQTNVVGPALASHIVENGQWTPALSSAVDFPIDNAPAVELYCLNATTNKWVPWTSACGGGGVSNSTQLLLTQIPTNGLIGLYTHSDCTNPYKDDSSNKNDGSAVAGVVEPICGSTGLTYYTAAIHNAWQLPTAATNQAVTYVFSLLPVLGNLGTNGAANQSILQSSTTGGVLSFIGDQMPGNAADAWKPGMGTVASFKLTSSSNTIPNASTISYSIGTGVAGDVDHIFSNGQEIVYHAQAATTPVAFNVGSMEVGGATFPFFGTESVTALYNRKLTAGEQVQVSLALNSFTQARSGLINPVPLGTTSLSNVLCLGDSITVGPGVVNSYCTTANLNVGETLNISKTSSVVGQYIGAIAMKAPQALWPNYSINATKNTAIIYGGTNDISALYPAQTVWNAAINTLKTAHFGGTKVIFMPMMSRIAADPGKNSFNALVNAQCAIYADYCVAPDDPNLYADGAFNNATFFQPVDHIHPTDVGQSLLGLYASNAYLQIYGSTQQAPTQVSTATYTVTASDNYITATANSAITLYNCLGYSRAVHIKVMPGLTVTVGNATAAQTIDGVDHSTSKLALTAGSNSTFQVVPGTTATGGCTWIIN